MASWTNIRAYVTGCLVSSSTIDQILDNIEVFAGHNHSGSAGDGATKLDDRVSIGQTNTGGNHQRVQNVVHFMPASNSGWSTVTSIGSYLSPCQGAVLPLDQTILVNNDITASGASLAYVVPISTSANFNNVIISFCFKVGPDGGAIATSLIGYRPYSHSGYLTLSGSTVIDTYSSTSKFTTGFEEMRFRDDGELDRQIPDGIHTIKILVVGQNVSSCGYGASLMGIYISSSV